MLSRLFDRFAAGCALATAASSVWALNNSGIQPQFLSALPWPPWPVTLIAKAIVLPFALAALCLRLRRADARVGWLVAAANCAVLIVAALVWTVVTWFPAALYTFCIGCQPVPTVDSSLWFEMWVELAERLLGYSEMLVGPIAIFVLSLLAWRAGSRLRWLWPLGAACGPAAVVYATAMLTEGSLPEPMWSIVSIVEGGLISAWYVALTVILLRTPRAVPSDAADASPADVSIAST